MNRIILIVMSCLMVASGCTRAPQTAARPHQPAHSDLVLSASLDKRQFQSTESILINVVYSNHGAVSVDVEEGSLSAVFPDKKQENMFMQAVRASYKRGHKTVTLNPGETFQDVLILMPKENVKPGTYRAKVLSTLRHGHSRAIEVGNIIFKIK